MGSNSWSELCNPAERYAMKIKIQPKMFKLSLNWYFFKRRQSWVPTIQHYKYGCYQGWAWIVRWMWWRITLEGTNY